MKSNFLDDIEDSNNAVATAACKHIARVAKVQREACSAQVLDLSARFEHLLSIEDLDFVGASTTSDDEVTGAFLELCLVDHAWLL